MSTSFTATTDYDVAIIGGGLAGLTAAVGASRTSGRVVLVEANLPGGRARSVGYDGMLLNDGPHALYLTGAGAKILAEIGIDPPGADPLSPAYFRRGDEVHVAPAGARSLISSGLLSAREKVAFPKLFNTVLKCDVNGLDSVPMAAWLDDHTRSPTLRSMIESLIRLTTYSNDLARLPAATGLGQLRMGFAGVRYLHGGWQSLVVSLLAAARRQNVEVHDHVPALAINRTGEGWRITTPVGDVGARRIIIATGPAVAARLLGARDDAFDHAGAPVFASVLDLILDVLPTRPICLGLDEPVYVSAHHPPADLGQSDRILMSAMWYHAPGESSLPEVMRARLRRHFDVANSGRAMVLNERYLHRLVVANGAPEAARGGARGRPVIAVPEMPHAFVAGDWVGPEGLLADAAIASGWAAGVLAAA